VGCCSLLSFDYRAKSGSDAVAYVSWSRPVAAPNDLSVVLYLASAKKGSNVVEMLSCSGALRNKDRPVSRYLR
jgi:hypothetical protein